MDILIYGLNYAPELTGIGKYTGEMAAWLAARGHRVRVVTAPPYYPAWKIADDYRGRGYIREGGGPAGDGYGEPLVFRCPLYVPEKVTGLKRVRHLFSFALSSFPMLMREVMASRAGAPDIIWTVEPTFFCAPFALLASRLAHTPAWLHVQDFEVDAAFDLGMLPKKGPIHTFAMLLEKTFSKAFQRVSSISVRMVERSLTKDVRPERIVLFPNWVDVDLVKPQDPDAPNRFRSELGLQGKTVFLYSGNMGNKQGLELLPKAAAALRDDASIHFLLCGEGAFRAQLEEMVQGLPNVTLLPLQPLESLNELLNCADVHLLPQRADAADLVMPSKLTGMLSSGRATIASSPADTQLGTVISGGVDGSSPCGVVIPPENVDAMVDAVRMLAENPTQRNRMGLNAREYAVRNLGREQVLEQFERDLQSAVAEYRGLPFERPQTPFRFALVDRRRRRRPPVPPVPAE
ncbi:glycosyltransferase WbuB [Terriglobus sp. ADX1]